MKKEIAIIAICMLLGLGLVFVLTGEIQNNVNALSYGTCPNNQYATAITTTTLNCASASSSQIKSAWSNQIATSKTTYISSNLTAVVSANTNYVFTAYIFISLSSNAGYNFAIHALSGATMKTVCGFNSDALTGSSACVTSFSTQIFGSNQTGALSTNVGIIIYGNILVGSTSGTLELDFVNTSGVGNTVVTPGSFIITTVVNE